MSGDHGIGTQIVVGVVVIVLAALVLAFLGLNDDGSNRNPQPTVITTQPVAQIATVCNTPFGSCLMQQSLPVGSPCTCYDGFGNPLGSGTAS